MFLLSSVGLAVEGDFNKFRQDIADNTVEVMFDAIFPSIRDQVCGDLFSPTCGIVDRTWWAVKTVTSASWATSAICLFAVIIDRNRERIETVLYYIGQFLEGWFIILPIAGIEYLVSVPARVRGEYSDD